MGLLSTIGAASARAYGFTRSAIAAAIDSYFNLTTLLLPGDGTNGAQNNTFLDSSTNNFTITRNGNTTQGTFSPFSQTGWSNYFDGTGDYLLGGNSTDYTLGTGEFCIEFWMWTGITASTQGLLGTGGAATGTGLIFLNSGGGAGSIRMTTYGGTAIDTAASVWSANTWTHVVITRASSNCRIFINGVLRAYGAFSDNVSGADLSIGRSYYNLDQDYYTGYLSNFRWVKGSVPTAYQTSATSVGTSVFTSPTAPLSPVTNTKLLTCQSNRFIDTNTEVSAKTVTAYGNTSVQAFSPFAPTAAYSAATNGGSGYFDGSGDYLTKSNINFSTNAFTIEGWFYVTSSAANVNYWGQDNGGGTNPKMLLYGDNSGNFVFETGSVSGAVISVSRTTYIKVNAWQHIVIARGGTGTNQTAMFIDGVRVGTGTCASLSAITAAFNLGYIGEAFGVTFNGYVSGFRIVNGTDVYGYSNTTITVPTAPPTNITNTNTLLNFTNGGIIDATSKNVLETVGNAQISTTQSKFGGSSMYFDGTGDYLDAPQSDLYSMRTGNFTLEFWIYFSSTSGTQVIYTGRNTTTPYIQLNSGALQFGFSGGPDNVINYTWNPSATTWYHVAFVRSSGTLSLYINGTSAASASNSTDWATPAYARIAANNSGASAFNGYLDDFRLTKGYARYTSNFTAPTAAFPVQ